MVRMQLDRGKLEEVVDLEQKSGVAMDNEWELERGRREAHSD